MSGCFPAWENDVSAGGEERVEKFSARFRARFLCGKDHERKRKQNAGHKKSPDEIGAKYGANNRV